MLGLAIGVALVIAISALSRGLDHAQKTALDPLSSIGTDLTVTLAPQQQDTGFGGGAVRRRRLGGGGQVLAGEPVGDHRPLEARQARHALRPRLLPARARSSRSRRARRSRSPALDGVAAVSSGLMLSGVHQEGTVPKIVAKIRTGGAAADRHRPRALPADAGRAGEDPGVLREARSRRTAARDGAGDHGRRAGDSGAGGRRRRPARRRRRPGGGGRRVLLQRRGRQVPAARRSGTSAGRSRRRSRRSSSSSTRRRRTSRARATRSAASTRRSRTSASSPRRWSRAAASSRPAANEALVADDYASRQKA